MNWLRSLLSLPTIAVLTMLVALGLVRAGTITPIACFGTVMLAWVAGGVGSILLGVAGLWRNRQPGARRTAFWRLGLGVLLSAALLAQMRSTTVPPIHDITTNPQDPPEFTMAGGRPAGGQGDLSYPQGGADVPRQQAAAYPDLQPIRVPVSPEQAHARVLAAIESLGWTIAWSSAAGGQIEAIDVTPLFRFVDDIAVRIRADASGSVVDVRSVSRVGRSDLGANAARIRALRELLQSGPAAPPPE